MLDHPLGSLYVVELYRFELPDAGAPEQLLRQLVVARRAVEHDQLLSADPFSVNRCCGPTTSTSSSSYRGRLSTSGCSISRASPSCTSSFKTISRTSSECPVLTETATLGCAAVKRSRIVGRAYVLTPGDVPRESRPPEAPRSSPRRCLPSSRLAMHRSAYGTNSLPASVRRIPRLVLTKS